MPFDGTVSSSDLQSFWHNCQARGLFPLAIARGSKAPIGEGWNVWTSPMPHPGAAAIGIRCGDNGLSAFDVDKNDAATANRLKDAFKRVLGASIPIRVRPDSPRFLIPYILTDAPVTGHTYRFPDGDGFQIIAGQFVAYGPHKDTGLPYQWENWDQEFPRLTQAQLQEVLAAVPAMAGTSLSFGVHHETASEDELREAKPRNEAEWRVGRQAAERFLGTLKQELLGKYKERGMSIFALVGTLKFAMQNQLCSRDEVENAIIEAGHDLNSKHGGRTLAEEIDRQENDFPVLRGNAIMSAIVSYRTLQQGAMDALAAPSLAARTGLELSLEDRDEDLPWLVYGRVLAGEIHFVTGHSGAGKSAVVSDLVYHFLVNRPWLDADIERPDGHVLWIAAEDDYGTEARMRWLFRQEPNAQDLANRFHLVRGVPNPAAFELHCVAQVQAMAAMGKRVDFIILDTWGASGLCMADNDTEAVLRAMFTLKQIVQKTGAAMIIPDHLPLGNEDAWQKGNGAKSGNAGFVYRVTVGKRDLISLDCGKVRGAPKARSYTGRVSSEIYGKDKKGRDRTVNIFRRVTEEAPEQKQQTAVMRLAGWLPGAQRGLGALQAGHLVMFESVAGELGDCIPRHERNAAPDYVITIDGARTLFGEDLQVLLDKALAFKMKHPYIGVRTPLGFTQQSVSLAGFDLNSAVHKMPWE